MKAILFSLALAATFNATAQSGAARQSLALGSEIPNRTTELRSTADDGRRTNLQSAATKNGLLVMFSCNTCPFVVKSQMRTKEVMKAAQEAGIGMVIINSNEAYRDGDDSYEQMQRYGRSQGYGVPYLLDEGSALADAFGASRTPEVFLFNGEGKLVYKGAMEDNPAAPAESKEMYLLNAMRTMVSGDAPMPAETKSIGCSIKRKS